MALMARHPDKYFDLAIVDPPYDYSISKTHVINMNPKFKGTQKGREKSGFKIGNSRVNALFSPPNKLYFEELFRVSKNQIIWGGNYFDLPKITAWLIWDKKMEILLLETEKWHGQALEIQFVFGESGII